MKLSQLAFFALVMLMMACKSNPKEALTRKWKVDPAAFKTIMKEEMDKMKKDNPEQAKQMEAMLPMMEGMLTGITLEFKADGSAEMVAMGKAQTGKWSLSDDGKKITVDDNGKKEEMEVVELSKSKLVLKMGKTDKDKLKLPFIPAS
jgi:Lipocalin-like domain